MTAVRIYGLIWLLVLAATGVSYVTGLINAMTLPILGFLISTLTFMGFAAVLPVWLNDHFSPKTYPAAFRNHAPKLRK